MENREFNTQVESLYNQVQQEINNLKNLLLGLDLLEEIIEDFDGKVINKRIETKFKEKSKSDKMYLRVNKSSYTNTTFLSYGYSQEELNIVVEFRDKRLNSKDTLKNLEEVRERTTLKIEGLEEFTLIKIYELQCEGLDLINKVRFYNTSLSKSSSLYYGLFVR